MDTVHRESSLAGRIGQAKPHIESLRAHKPDLGARAGELVRRSLKIEPLVDDPVDGPRATDLAIS